MAKKNIQIDEVLLQLKVNESRVVKYIVTRDGSVKRHDNDDKPDSSVDIKTLISFTNDDYFIKTSEKLNDSKAVSLLTNRTEAPANLKLINLSSSGFVYGTPKDRNEIKDKISNVAVYPLMELLNFAVASKGKSADITGFLIGSNNDVLVLVGYGDENKLLVSVSTDVSDVKSQLDIFAMSSKIKEDYEYLILDHEELFFALDLSKPYPNYNSFYGVKESNFWVGVSAISLASLVVMGGFYLYQTSKVSRISTEIHALESQVSNINSQAAELISNHIPSVILKSSVDTDAYFKHAEKLWINGSYIDSELNKDGEKHIIHLPIDHKSVATDADVKGFYKIKAPENCALDSTQIGASLNEITAIYNCKDTSSNLSIFWF